MQMVFFINWCIILFIESIIAECPSGHFKLKNMDKCLAYLSCNDYNNMKLIEQIGRGAVKTVYKAKWLDNFIAVSELKEPELRKDFLHGWKMLNYLKGPLVVQAVGSCFENKNNIVFTEYHPHGNAVDLIKKLPSLGVRPNNIIYRLNLCLNYANILEHLHEKKYVNCDSNSLAKTLSQILLVDDGSLVINDLDSLAENSKGVTCGGRPLHGNFVAPEQIGYPLPVYDEKTDIWKAADICAHFLSDLVDAIPVVYHVMEVHSRCKNKKPSERPTASELKDIYIKVRNLIRDEL